MNLDDTTPAASAAQDTSTDDDTLPKGDDDAAGESHANNEVALEGTQASDVTAAAAAGHRCGDHHTPLDEATAAQVTAAAEAAVPGGTVLKVEAEDDGYEAHVMGTDGIEVEVYFDQDFAVLKTVPAG